MSGETPAPGGRIRSRVFLALAVAITATALLGSLLPRVPMPSFALGDKLMHACGYAALGACWWRALNWPARLAWAAVFAFGVGIEVLQGITPWRSFEWADMLANGAGAALGIAAMGLLTRGLSRRPGRR